MQSDIMSVVSLMAVLHLIWIIIKGPLSGSLSNPLAVSHCDPCTVSLIGLFKTNQNGSLVVSLKGPHAVSLKGPYAVSVKGPHAVNLINHWLIVVNHIGYWSTCSQSFAKFFS